MPSEFVVLAMEVKDTALIMAETQEEAIEQYEIPEELQDVDIVTWAMPKAEFDEALRVGVFGKDADQACDCNHCSCEKEAA
jgi:hypothetical protein